MSIGDDEKKIQNVVIELLQDNLLENKKILNKMQITVIILIISLVGLACYYEWSFKKFLSQYDFETPITTTNDLINENASMNNISIETNVPAK